MLRDARLRRKILCIIHDVEADIDTQVSKEECDRNLARILKIEARHEINATYNVLGLLYREKIGDILKSGKHAIGFHSYDHNNSRPGQLEMVRTLDVEVKGYRPPNSRITPELTDQALVTHNFQWFASSSSSLHCNHPRVQNGVVKIPIGMDDWPLQSNQLTFERWRNHLLDQVARRDFFAFGLHDCYARHWLESYDDLLLSLKKQGATFKTCDEVSSELVRSDPGGAVC